MTERLSNFISKTRKRNVTINTINFNVGLLEQIQVIYTDIDTQCQYEIYFFNRDFRLITEGIE